MGGFNIPRDSVGCSLEFAGASYYIVRLHGICMATHRSWFGVFVAGIMLHPATWYVFSPEGDLLQDGQGHLALYNVMC